MTNYSSYLWQKLHMRDQTIDKKIESPNSGKPQTGQQWKFHNVLAFLRLNS